jgi:1-acyl-sn-glycerol-3-phosphate acyltransferase
MLARAASRVMSVGGHALETIGRARWNFRRDDRRARAALLHETCVRVCELHGFSVEVEGAPPSGPCLLVANHLSYIDPLILGSLSPCVPVAKAEIAGWPIVGAGAQALGVLFVKRGDAWSGARALRSSLRSLQAGVPVLGFPEGTTSHGGDVLPFYRGLFGIAARARVPVVPLALRYDDPQAAWVGDTWFLPHYLRTAMRPQTRAFVRVGEPMDPSGAADTLADAARTRVTALLRGDLA